MAKLYDELAHILPPGMYIPKPFELLFAWIEGNGLFIDTKDSHRIGFLFPVDELKANWTEKERLGGTYIEFSGEGNNNLKSWFGHERSDVLTRLCVFAKTGADGSMAALWLDNDGQQRIVHLGSGCGSTLVCVLADVPVDFLRLLAIGYDEICWNEEFQNPPNAHQAGGKLFVHPNVAYQRWVRETFSVTVPETALEIVRHASEMEDSNSDDPFFQWVEKNIQ